MFYGLYEYTLDNKGRLCIPKKIKERCHGILYIMKGFEGALALYTSDAFDSLAKEVETLDFNKKETRAFLRVRLSSVCELECPADKPLKNWDDECYSCDEKLIVRLDTHCNIEEDCEDICPNRTILYFIVGNIPSIPNCPPDKPLMDREGICYPCDAPIAIGLELNERLCTQACPKQRAMINGYCQLLKK